MANDIEIAKHYADKEWEEAAKFYWKFMDKIVELRKNPLFFKNESDMWYLGFCLGATSGLKEYDIKMILEEIELGLMEGRNYGLW